MLEVHIINMNRARGKWERCSRRFHEKDFRVLRQEGYDVRDMNLSGYHTGFQKAGALGCNLSHRALWEKLLQSSNKDFLIVAEDDAIPLVSSQEFMDQIKKLPDNIDFVHFGCGTRCRKHPFIGAHCYLVTRNGARKYFAHWKNRIDVALDIAIGKTPGVNMMRVNPELATFEKLRATDSDIVNTNNPIAALLDYIPFDENRTLGYVLFYPGYFDINFFHLFIVLSLFTLFFIKIKK